MSLVEYETDGALAIVTINRPEARNAVNRIVEPGQALAVAGELAAQLAAFPQACMRADRRSAYEQWSMTLPEALGNEYQRGIEPIRLGETVEGARRFSSGIGRHGQF